MVSRFSPDGSIPPGSDPVKLLYEEARGRIREQDFDTWLRDTPCEFHPPDRFVLIAPNRFRLAWMEKNFRELLRTCARSLFDIEVRIEFEVHAAGPAPGLGPEPASTRAASTDGLASLLGALPLSPSRREAPGIRVASRQDLDTSSIQDSRPNTTKSLKPEFTFDNFVAGPSNRLALAAAITVCDAPGKAYNPLFLHGEPGVGKTHLLHAICHRILETTRLRLTYLTSETFLNRFVAAVLDSDRETFRRHCLETDVLVLDDIHNLSNKEKTQEELFHVFNRLLESHKHVILSSAFSPHATPGIHARLTSRFQWGLTSQVDAPDFELRVAILLRKARLQGVELPPHVAEFIAGRVKTSVRELEGALHRVLSIAALHKSPLDLDTAREALQDVFTNSDASGTITVAQILRVVQDFYHLKPRDILARSKVRSIVLPRQIGMFLARELTQLSLEEIGAHFGGRDHTTVLYARDRIETLRQKSPQVQSDIQAIRSRLSASRST
jgi:chromosomal replication initiator protein